MSNPSFAGSNSPKHSLGSSKSASNDHPPSPPPSPVHPPLPFPIHPLPHQVFIPEEVAPFNWSDEEQEDLEELWLKVEEDVKDAVIVAFMDTPIKRRRRQRPSQSGSESSASSLLTLRSQNPLTVPLTAPLTQGMMKARRRRKKMRWSTIRLQIISKRTLGMTRMPMRYGLLELPAIRPAVFSFCLLFYYYYVFFCLSIYWLKL